MRIPPGQLTRVLAWVALLLAGVFFLTTGGTYPGIASVDAHLLGQVIAIVVLGGWLVLAVLRPQWRPRTPLLLPLALAAAAYLASALFSERPRLSLEPTTAGLGWALAMLFLTRLLSVPWFRARAAVLMTAFVAIVAIGYLVQVAGEWITWWGLVGRFALPPLRPSFAALFLGSPNLIATALMLLAPLVVVLVARRTRSVGIALAVAAAIATFVSGSRGAYAGVGVGVLVALLLFVIRRGPRLVDASGIVGSIRRRPVLAVPVVGVVGAGLLFAPSVIQRFQQGGADLRFDLWRSALAIFAEHPLFGGGPGTWVQLKVAENPPGVPNLILPQAHDMYVQAAAELGIVGLVALAVLAGAVARRLWASWRSDRWLEAGAIVVSLVAFAGQSIVDNFSNLPFVCLIVITLVAWVDGGLALDAGEGASPDATAPEWRRRPHLRTAVVPIAGLVAIALAVPTLLRIDRAASLEQQGNDAALRGDWATALDAFDKARAADPGFTLYEIQAARALAQVGRNQEARDFLGNAVQADPVAVNVVGLAALQAELGERETALANVRRAATLGIGEPVVALNAGLIAERLGDTALAVDQLANAIGWDPPLARSSIFASPPRSIPKTAIVEAARSRVDAVTAELIAAYAGDPIGARTRLLAMPPSDVRDLYLPVTWWLAGDADTALGMLEQRLAADPHDWLSAAWAARIAHASGRDAEFDVYSRWAIAQQGDSAPSVINELSAVPAARDAWEAGLPGAYPWAVYLRPTVPYLLMPQLTLIGTG